MLMNEYETTLVMRPDLSGDKIENTLERLRQTVGTNGGKLLAINHWGRKKLGYEIEKNSRGVFVHTHYLGAGDLVSELERTLRIQDNVMRYLTIRLDGRVDPSSREEKQYVKPDYDAADADDGKEEAQAAGGEQVAKENDVESSQKQEQAAAPSAEAAADDGKVAAKSAEGAEAAESAKNASADDAKQDDKDTTAKE